MSRKSRKCSILWNISLYTKLHSYQLSQEITSRLLKYLDMVTLCIDFLQPMYIRTCSFVITYASELRKQRSIPAIARVPGEWSPGQLVT